MKTFFYFVVVACWSRFSLLLSWWCGNSAQIVERISEEESRFVCDANHSQSPRAAGDVSARHKVPPKREKSRRITHRHHAYSRNVHQKPGHSGWFSHGAVHTTDVLTSSLILKWRSVYCNICPALGTFQATYSEPNSHLEEFDHGWVFSWARRQRGQRPLSPSQNPTAPSHLRRWWSGILGNDERHFGAGERGRSSF